jgi:16S rRNA (cytosine1402-N4)-methyltransferase
VNPESPAPDPAPRKRRPRYPGKNPRRFEQKYKERNAADHPETLAKVLASGKTPAGTHRPIMVAEILEVLRPAPGETAVDCTLGFGGHAEEILRRIAPAGMLIGIDADPIEIVRTEARMRTLGFDEFLFRPRRSNFGGLPKLLAAEGRSCADVILADLGVSSMQIDDPSRGFSFKENGPLDMRMNPHKGQPASMLLLKTNPAKLRTILEDNADEPHAERLSAALAERLFETTHAFAAAVKNALPGMGPEEVSLSTRRVFQALRICVNEEFTALDTLLRQLPDCLSPGARVAILSFHSGEDRRVKKSFEAGLRSGDYSAIAPEVIRPSAQERRSNTRSVPAKLRWAVRSQLNA